MPRTGIRTRPLFRVDLAGAGQAESQVSIPSTVRGELQMSNHPLSGLRPRALAIAVTLCCIAPAAMAAGRQDLQNANLAQMQARYSSFVAANGAPGTAHARHERLLNMDSESNLLLSRR